ncbi:MAG: carboxypeptidase regulatory-like domain-containing protein [Acidobacteriota bacterium]|nr:MAG: carboxypeptidase regulatory-like domain-containing protein [Acidobacteriota bacterium]
MSDLPRKFGVYGLIALVWAFGFAAALPASAKTETETEAGAPAARLGVIKGVVRDKAGNPISNATVAVFRSGTSRLLKQVTATKSGKFIAKIIPGTYTILAVAQGFNPVTLEKVKVNGESELVYGFNLEKAGSGNTLPEKRNDRLSARTAIRAAQRSIYQVKEGEVPSADTDDGPVVSAPFGGSVDQTVAAFREDEGSGRKGQSIVETFYASGKAGSFAGVNFATLQPVGKDAEFVISGQTGYGPAAPQRFETAFSFKAGDDHRVRLKGSLSKLGDVVSGKREETLGQVSFQALDQWNVREGVILVLGIDYSRFVGAGDDFSVSPRIGFLYDVDSKTRFKASYTTVNEERSWQRVIELESSQVLFREPVAVQDIPLQNSRPLMNKSSRLEFGVERVLDNRSSVEANVFFDSVVGRGLGFETYSEGGQAFNNFVAQQSGSALGMRVVYNRRLNGIFSTAAGYAYGTGQRLSEEAISDPASVLRNDVFQTVFGQFTADIRSGTSVRTIFRLSPRATVFAIDPFEGRLAIYDPSLSVMVTQELPSWGLPIDAEAVLDARNLFDRHAGVSGDEGTLQLNLQRRMLRGGILVRF